MKMYTYFKGTTWTIEIVRQLLFKDDERMLKLSKMLATPPYHYLEDGAREYFKQSYI